MQADKKLLFCKKQIIIKHILAFFYTRADSMKRIKIVTALIAALSFRPITLVAAQAEAAGKTNGCLTRCFRRVFGCCMHTKTAEQRPLLDLKNHANKPAQQYGALSNLSLENVEKLSRLLSPTELSKELGSLSLNDYNEHKKIITQQLQIDSPYGSKGREVRV